MITAIVVFVSVYLAVRVALIEIVRSLNKLISKWETTEKVVTTTESRKNSVHSSSSTNLPILEQNNINHALSVNKDNHISTAASRRSLRRCGIVKPEFHWNPNSINKARLTPFSNLNKANKEAQAKSCTKHDMENPFIKQMAAGYCPTSLGINKIHSSDWSPVPDSENLLLPFTSSWMEKNLVSRTFQYIVYIFRKSSKFYYCDVSDKVLTSDRVEIAIKTAISEELKDKGPDFGISALEQKHKNRAVAALIRMKSCISSLLLKIAWWVMYKLLGRMLTGLDIKKEQMETLKRTSQHNVPIIYLPLHRSHLDYILVTFILFMNNIRAPLVAAGDNLMIPFFGALLRGLGAFFIKRKLDPQKGRKDHVYRAILHTYMAESLKSGHSLEFFIEGGRTRSGKACMPKAGLLSVVVNTLLEGNITEAYVVPVAISYEKIMDGNFVNEQMGKPKVMESFTSALKAIWRTLHSNYGRVKVDFCEPFSMQEFLKKSECVPNPPVTNKNSVANYVHANSPVRTVSRKTSVYGVDVVDEEHRQAIKDLAEYVVYDAFNSTATMSTSVLAFLLLTKHRKGTTQQQLIQSFDWLRAELAKRRKEVGFTGESSDIIKQAATLLGEQLVTTEKVQMEWSSSDTENNNMKIVFYKPVVRLPCIFELQYYANSLLPVFLMESVVVNSFCSLIGDDTNSESRQTVFRQELVNQSLELCNILQYEFIFTPPGTSLYAAVNATINNLISSNHLQAVGVKIEEWDTKSWSIPEVQSEESCSSDEEGNYYRHHQKLKANENEEHRDMLQFLRCVLGPFIQSYWVAAVSLPKLLDEQMEESSFLEEIRDVALEKMHQGQLSYEECFGTDSLKNAVKVFEHWKVLESGIQNSRSVLRICSTYNSENNIRQAISRVERFKKCV